MNPTVYRKQTIRVYAEDHRNFIRMPSDCVHAVREYLRSHGVTSLDPQRINMSTQSIELPPDTDLKAVQLLLGEWAKG